MQLLVNNYPVIVQVSNESGSITLQDALEYFQLNPKELPFVLPSSFAITKNDRFIPRSSYAQQVLQEQDRVDFMFPQPGG
jgi:sulfur carrier protein ThiS